MFSTTPSEMGQKIGRQSRLQDKGYLVLGYMLALNKDQALGASDQDTYLAAYKDAFFWLMAGNMEKAKELIQAVATDATIILEADQDAAIVEIDAAISEEA